jgi:hypothetical protein
MFEISAPKAEKFQVAAARNPRDVELVRDQSGIHRSGAAMGEEHEIMGIIAAAIESP